MQSYKQNTYASNSAIKRWLHKKRFNTAIKALDLKPDDTLLDYGCGDAHLLKLCANFLPASPAGRPTQNLFGFEPAFSLRDEATKNVAPLDIKIVGSINGFTKQFTKIACLETCEHLLESDLEKLFSNVQGLLAQNGTAIFSVPIEIGLPALFKNIFRFLKNKSYDNLTFKNYFRTTFGLTTPRNLSQQLDGINYIYSHIGFNHKKLEKTLKRFFKITQKTFSPVNALGSALNNTIYYTCVQLSQ